MVALSPNTNEKSPWDILDEFPKLHSRAREAKTLNCTEAPNSKSLCRIEIWQAIYDCRDGLESFTRDPIGYKGSPHNLYEFVGGRAMSATDPTGETWAEWGCCPGINVYIGRRCSLRCNTGMPAVLTGQVNELARILANQLFDDPAKNAAMRHCIALGIISHESGCPCAKCIGDAREYYQETCQGQSPRYTVQGRYHNEAGYECAGCGGISPPKGKPFIAWPLGYSPPAEWGKIVNCCLEKVQSGRVDDPTNPNQPEPEVGPLHGGGISPWIYF